MYITKKKQEKINESLARMAAILRLISKTNEEDEGRLKILRELESKELRKYKRLCQ